MFNQIESDSSMASSFGVLLILAAIVAIPIIGLVLIGVGSADPNAKRILEDHGYNHVQIVGGRLSGCDGGASQITEFRAFNDKGIKVTGDVCTTSFGKHYIVED